MDSQRQTSDSDSAKLPQVYCMYGFYYYPMDVSVFQAATKINESDHRALYHLKVRVGLVSWTLARNSDALSAFEQLLKANFPAEKLPPLEGALDLERVREFVTAVAHANNISMLDSSAVRSFFAVSNLLSLDPNRSVLSVPLNVLAPQVGSIKVEVGVVVCLAALVLGFLPIFANTPSQAEFLVGLCFAVFCWFALASDGLLHSILTKRLAHSSFRHADSVFLFVAGGVVVGLLLNSSVGFLAGLGYTLVRGMALFALADLVFRLRKKRD